MKIRRDNDQQYYSNALDEAKARKDAGDTAGAGDVIGRALAQGDPQAFHAVLQGKISRRRS